MSHIIPKRLNDFPVCAVGYRGAGSYFVLLHRRGHRRPWVSATWTGGEGWIWGHYCTTRQEALDAIPEASWVNCDTFQTLNKETTS